MVEILRDPAWQFVGVVLGILGLGVTIWIYWMQLQTKELAFGLLSSRRPLAISDELSSRVTVLLDGKAVGNLHLLIYALKNSGRRAIAQSDWERAFVLSFGSDTIVSAEVASQVPLNLGAKITVDLSTIKLEPLLLNPGDQIIVKILVSSQKPSPTCDMRILDVPAFSPINTVPKLPRFFESGLPPVMYLSLLMAGGFFAFYSDRRAALTFLGFAVFIPVFGWANRALQNTGTSARRRISETHPLGQGKPQQLRT